MPRRDNPVLGAITCIECKGQATVHQAKTGKGKFLYERCPNCGADQKYGKEPQTRRWHQTVWRDGCKPESPPPNVVLGDFNPDEPEPSEKPEQHVIDEPESKGRGKIGVVAALAALSLVVFGITR